MMDKPSLLPVEESCPLQATTTALGSSFSNTLIYQKCMKERYGRSFLPAHFGLHSLGNFPTHIYYLLITIHCHTVYNYTVYNEHTVYIRVYFYSLPFYCIVDFFTIIIVYCGCCDTEIPLFAGLIKEFLSDSDSDRGLFL